MKYFIALGLSVGLVVASGGQGIAEETSTIPIRLSIPDTIESYTKGFKKISTGNPKADGGTIQTKWIPRKQSTASSEMKEKITPVDYAPPELHPDTSLKTRADGVTILVGTKLEEASSFPVTPATPKEFETIETGWQLIGTVRRIEGGLIEFRGKVRHVGVTVQRAVYGEGSDPIFAEFKGLLGKTKDVVLTENRAEMLAKSVTETPLIIRAKPGKVYEIELTAFGKTLPAKITLGAEKAGAKNAILQAAASTGKRD